MNDINVTKIPIHLNQWNKINQIMVFYKTIALTSILVVVMLIGYLFYNLSKPPIVIDCSNNLKRSMIVISDIPKITKNDIEELVKSYILQRYEWNSFIPAQILEKIKPLVTSGLLEKIEIDLKKSSNTNNKDNVSADANNNSSMKNVKQKILINNISIGEQKITVKFDRIVTIENLKLVSSLELAIEVIKGEITINNPFGIYINRIVEYEKN
ncbi:MAG: hypothetical protein HQK49_09120 [Oligoflexia bacterium]|nr:hypothetical protein [Oligoflexia bacterium]